MAGAEAFTILAVLEARDRISEVIAKVDKSVTSLGESASRTAETVRAAGSSIDESLLQTASGADAVEIADAKLAAAQDRVAIATERQAAAERELLAASEEAAALVGDEAAASDRLAAAQTALADAEAKTAAAAKAEADALKLQADTAAASAAKTGESTAAADAAAASQGKLKSSSEGAAAGSGILSKGMGMAALAVAAVGYASVKAAGNFESATQHLVTDAGESQKNLQMIRTGILNVATATGTSAKSLTDAMYHIESSGVHGAQALDLLKTSAEGAKVGNADLDTVSKTLVGTLNSYSNAGYSSTQMMNALITSVSNGDMKMQDLASSLGNVAPLAAAAGLDFSQVGGAIATMTSQNMSAQQATQDLANTIRNLQKPSNLAVSEMQQLGLSSNDVQNNLGKRGLTGTLEMLTNAIAQHTKGGQVLINTMKSSANATQDANIMIKQLPPSIQGVSQELLKGGITAAQYSKDIKGLSAPQQNMAHQFMQLVKSSGSFNDLLKSGKPAAQTYTAALSTMLGGATGLNTALMLTGGRMQTFKDNVSSTAESLHKGGSAVDNWSKIQGTFNQKMSELKATVEAAGISIGMQLLPAVSAVASGIVAVVGPIARWVMANHTLVGLLGSMVGAALAVVAVMKVWSITTKALAAAQLLLNTAMEDNPIGLIIMAIAAVVAGLIYAYNHFKTFHMIVVAAFEAVKIAAVALWHGLTAVWSGISGGVTALWHGLQAVWNGITSGVMALWHGLVAVWNGISSVTMAVWSGIKGFFEKWWPLLLMIFAAPIALLIGIWNHFHTQITNTAESVWNGIKDFFSSIWDGIKAVASALWASIKAAVIQPMEAVFNFLRPLWSAIGSFLSSVWNGIKAVASSLWAAIKAAMITPLEEAWHTISSVVGQIGSAIWNGLVSAWHAVEHIGSWFLSIGSDIVNGIINGVENAAGSLFSSLKNLASDALNAAKSFLGIGSPSKLFRDEIGQWIPHGIAEGVGAYADVAQGAVSKMVSKLPTTASMALKVAATPVSPAFAGASAGAAAGAGSGTSIYFDLRGSQVMSDSDMDKLVNKIGNRLATQILPAGGTRIRM